MKDPEDSTAMLDQPADVVRQVHIPDGLTPEFPCPTEWGRDPVIAGRYVARQPGGVPLWIVVVAADAGYHLARVVESGESAQTDYYVGSGLPLNSQRYAEALRRLAAEAARRNCVAA